ncbi:predicted protein [Meyerozyma guilliermondii ATCC 6260]|uniref:Uncharacterized protein n=1 Tax=Meyerozyma guilliermondii (strain ATCC 6260 / CBS 566 / DSM 6381 / JCM 1539 / NBRC 10279 / NRRL Y-324) TaxID=294746 RepID=A5DHM8_PICGU|nr:uncharacterized protein PGUG_02779 [Meyerozyma guilliermondii ATCC 6260]EDK38681.2 predicted protein [Meyerozyma guilliermondii ATCC 6260]
MTTPQVQGMTPPQAEESNPLQFEGMTPQQMEERIRQLERELSQVRETPQGNDSTQGEVIRQQSEMIARLNEMTRRQGEMITRLNETTRQQGEVIARLNEETRQQAEMIARLNEANSQQREVITPRIATRPRISETWMRAREFAVAFLCLSRLVFSTDAEINISIYLWIGFALVYVWLIKNRILSVYASYQHKAPLKYSLSSASACFGTCLLAFYFYRQSQNLTISQILHLCVLAINGSMLETVSHHNLLVNGVTRDGLKLWTTVH